MHQGSCLCGEIKYRVDDDLKFVVHCHCRFCSKAHGAAFTTLLFMPFQKLEVVEGKDWLASYEVTASNALRCFCSKCGTRLYNYLPAREMISLVVATLDTDVTLHAIANINVESKCSWHRISDKLPQFSSLPSRSEFAALLASK